MKKINFSTYPMIAFAGSMILHTLANDDHVLSMISTIMILVSAVFMSVGILKINDQHRRVKCAWAELCYCAIMWGISFYLVNVVGNIVTTVICLAFTCLYVLWICPQILHR